MRLRLEPATPEDAEALAALATAVANALTERHGKGPWSGHATARGALRAMKLCQVFVAKREGRMIASLTLGTRKPWAIDTKYFTPCERPLYLTGMAIDPGMQRRGLGRSCMQEAGRLGRQWPADMIRLDAYAAKAGASGFYRKCGLREVGRATYRTTPLVYFEMPLRALRAK